MVNGALLYPNIHLKNSKIIKESLLFYDNLYRIVPEGIIPKDDKEIKHFNDEYNLIKEISPKEYVKNTYKEFTKNLRNWSITASGLSFDEDEESYSRLHKDKVYDKLRKTFIEEGILEYDGTWFRGNASFIGNYMIYLAIEMSNKNDLCLVTNDVPAWVSQEFMNYDGNYADYAECSFGGGTHKLLGMYFIDYIPSNINEITFDSIVEFRDQYNTERKNFFNNYLKFQNEVSSITSTNVLSDKIEKNLDSFYEGIKDYKESCSYFKTDGFFGSKVFTFPTLMGATDTFVSIDPGLKSLLMAAGLFIGGLWDLISARQRISDIKKSNPYSYLVSLEKHDFGAMKHLNSRLGYEIKEFIDD